MTCKEPIFGSLVDLRTYHGGGVWDQARDKPHFVEVPCGLTTTHSCKACDKPICRWHLVAQHDHTDSAQRKVRGHRRGR